MVAGLIGDRYEITGLIASGGMGSVYRARDTILDRTVAVKVLKAGGDDPAFVAKFKSEATNAARLSHPNIVQVYDFGYEDGQPYMAMEYVDGQNLREILSSRMILRPDLAARIALQVASALEHARRNGLMHRDVKPENILITTDGIVKVADFGLSRALAESKATQAGVLFGTAAYLAPEQVQGDIVDHRADIYALGVVLFEMLTGKPPFEGDSPVVIAYKRVAEDVPSAMSINPGVPRELDVIIARATQRDAAARYATAGMMVEALRDVAPRSDTGDIGGLVHHTQAIPIVGEETIAVIKRDGRAPTRRNVKRRRQVALLILLALIATILYAVAGRTPSIAVPRLDGMTQQDGVRALEAKGFKVNLFPTYSDTVPANQVISTVPPGGQKAAKGSTITLNYSLGAQLFPLPDVTSKKFTDAERQLVDAGFKVRRIDTWDDKVPRLHVIDQDPKPSVPVAKGTTIKLTVSKGPEKVKIPNVIGAAKDTAIADLQDAGFEVRVVEKVDDKVPADHVISVSPKVDTPVAKGETVTLTVSTGPPPVKVPSVLCMTRKQAEDALHHVGLGVNFEGLEGNDKKAVDQDPVAGSDAPKGSTVNVVMGYGSTC
jgi:serine/threonine protein kinase/beta-lactam-binding protein with PASTA domain